VTTKALERWSAFLAQIEERHRALLGEAVGAAREALPMCNYDPIPIGTAWTTVTHRLSELERRIGDTWSEKVEAAFDAEEAPVDLQMVQLQRGRDLAFELENRREFAEAELYSSLARELYEASVAQQKQRQCRQCGAPLEIPLTYRALDVRCRHCNALSLFEPGTIARNVVVFGSHALANLAAQNERLQMRNAERSMNAARSPSPLALIKAYERAQIAYWFRYIGVKVQLEPELSDIAREVRERLEVWYLLAESEPNWVAAGRPREAI
jgi:hypothetical protein